MIEIIGGGLKVRKREAWDGLRTFSWQEFGDVLGELLPFAA